MPGYLLYDDDVETVASDEGETTEKILETMRNGMRLTREKYGKTPRVSHAKAHALLKGTLTIPSNLPRELSQGLFAMPGTYDVLVRMATAPGDYNDDSKVSTGARGLSIKILGVEGERLSGHTDATQDFLLATGKNFFCNGPKEFLLNSKPGDLLAPKLSDTTKGVVSDVARVTSEALQAVGLHSEKLDFFGHPKVHPLAEGYFSQTPFRFGDYVCKFGALPSTPGLKEMADKQLELKTPDALREVMVDFFNTRDAEFTMAVQLCTSLNEMPVEDPQQLWPEDVSPYRVVGTLSLPRQTAFDPTKEGYYEDLSFNPAHSLAAHKPLGGIKSCAPIYLLRVGRSPLRRERQGGGTPY